MASASKTVEINKPVETVFDFIEQGENNKIWRPGVVEIQRTSENVGLGAYYKQTLKGPMGNIQGDYEITKLEKNSLIEFQVKTGPARPTGSYKFKDLNGKTQVEFTLSFEPKGIFA